MIKIEQSTLDDFMATVNAHPEYSSEQMLEKFPEFNGNYKLLQSAYDYTDTYLSGKYKTMEELNSKFPEFFSNTHTWVDNAMQQDEELRKKMQGNSYFAMMQEAADNYTPTEDDSTSWKDTIKNGINSGMAGLIHNVGAFGEKMLLDTGNFDHYGNQQLLLSKKQALENIERIQNATEKASTSYDERLAAAERMKKGEGDERDKRISAGVRMVEELSDKQEEFSAKAKPNQGQDGFIDLIKEREIGDALQLGLATALESAPQMILAALPGGAAVLGTISAAGEYDRLAREYPDMPEAKRISSAVGYGFIEQWFEKKGVNPVKWFKKGAGKKITRDIAKEIEDFTTKGIRNKIVQTLKKAGDVGLKLLKESGEEGLEEVGTDLGQEAWNTVLDGIFGSNSNMEKEGDGLVNQFLEEKKKNPELKIWDFAKIKGQQYLEDFIGGAAAGLYMGSTSYGLGATGRYTKSGREKHKMEKAYYTDLNKAFDYVSEETGIDRKILEAEFNQKLNYDLKDAEIVKQIDRAMAKAQIQKDIEKRVGRYKNRDGNYYPIKSIKGNKGYIVGGDFEIVTDKDGNRVLRGNGNVTVEYEKGIRSDVPISMLMLDGEIVSEQELADELLRRLYDNVEGKKNTPQSNIEQAPQEQPVQESNAVEQPIPVETATEEQPTEPVQAEQAQSYPKKADGTPDYESMSPEQQIQYATETGGQDKANALVAGMLEDLQEEKDKIEKNKKISRLERMDKMAAIDEQMAQWQSLIQQETTTEENTDVQQQAETTTQEEPTTTQEVQQEPIVAEQEQPTETTIEPVQETATLPTEPLSAEQADALIEQMEQSAEEAPQMELTPENWLSQFGEDGMVDTPIGRVKMGENQYLKLAQKGREGKLGMIKPTLENPDVIIEDRSKAKDGQETEQESSYIFVKAFVGKNGEIVYYFTAITIKKDGREVVISNQEKERSRIERLLREGKLAYIKKATLPSASDTTIQGDQLTNPVGDNLSDSKDNTNSSTNQISEKKIFVPEGTDLMSDEIVLTTNGNGRYEFRKKTEDGKYYALDDKPLQSERKGKPINRSEVPKRIVHLYANGEIQEQEYILVNAQSEEQLKYYTRETIPVIPITGGELQNVKINDLYWQNEDGTYRPVYVRSEERRQNDFKKKLKEADSIDEALDYPLFSGRTPQGTPIVVTLRSLIEQKSKYKGKGFLSAIVEQITTKLNNDSKPSDIKSELRKRINEAIQIWNAVVERNGYDKSAKKSETRALVTKSKFYDSMQMEQLSNLDKLDNIRTNPLEKLKDCMDDIVRFEEKNTATKEKNNSPATQQTEPSHPAEQDTRTAQQEETPVMQPSQDAAGTQSGQEADIDYEQLRNEIADLEERIMDAIDEGDEATRQRLQAELTKKQEQYRNSSIEFHIGQDENHQKKSSENLENSKKSSTFVDENPTNNNEDYERTDEFRRIQEASSQLSEEQISLYHRAAKQLSENEQRLLASAYERLLARDSNGGLKQWFNLTGKGNTFQVAQVSGKLFHDIFEINRKYLENGELVDLHDDYSDCKCFLSSNGMQGFAIEPDGNVVSVFSLNPNDFVNQRGFLYAIKDLMIAEGGTHLDAYASEKQNLEAIYQKVFGAKTASVMDYNMEYDHDDIAANHGEPKVVFMVIGNENVERKYFNKDQYDEAVAHQQSQLPAKQEQTHQLSVDSPVSKTTEFRKAAGERVVQSLQKAGIEVETISEAEAEEKYIGEQRMKQMHDAGGVLYGFTDGKKIVLIAERMNPNTPIHEYTHMWVEAYSRENPKAWQAALELLKQTDEWYAVLNDPNYKGIVGDEQKVASEVLSRLTAEYFSVDTGKGKTRFDLLANNGLRVRVANAVKRFWDTVLGWFGMKVNKPSQLQELINRPVEDLLRSREPSKFDEKYKKINETLDKGGRDVLSLQEISELTDALQDDIRQRIKPMVFERVPFEALQGLLGEQRTLAETLAIVARRSRRQSRAVERNGREITSEEILSRDGSNTEMLLALMQYAKEKGIWIDNVVQTLDKRYGKDNRLRGGAESEVWADKENGVVIKAKVSDYYETVEEFLEGMLLNNWLFGGNEQHIIGIGIDRRAGRDGIRIVYETPYVETKNSTPLSQEEKDSFMANFGFKKVDGEAIHSEKKGESSRYTNGVFDVGDLHNLNIVRDENGIIRCTDPIIRWVRGEHYRERTVDEVKKDAANEELLDNEFEFQIQTPDPTLIEEEIKAKRQKMMDEVDSIESIYEKNGTALRLGRIAKAVTNVCDNTEPLRILQKKVNEWRKQVGKYPSPEKHDIRSLINRASSKSVSRINWFAQHEQKKMVEWRNKMEEAISKSSLMDTFHEDITIDDSEKAKTPHHINSARDLLERYLIAKDNVEREQFGIPARGRQEFEERMRITFEEYISLFESKIEKNLIHIFHTAVRDCTNVSIQALYDSGMITLEQFETFAQRDWYVPEKDFFEREVNGDNSEKKDKRSGGKNTLRASALQKAEGGDTLATNILEHIIHDVQNSICLSEENLCRQAMMDFVNDNLDYWEHYNLPFPTPVWYVKTGETANGEPIYERTTERPSNDLFDELAILQAKIQECKEALQEETDPDVIEQLRTDIRYYQNQMPIVSAKRAGESNPNLTTTSEEQVVVYREGIRYEMSFPKMVEVARALNGVYDLQAIDGGVKKVNATLASIYTTYNPTFFATNLARDIPYILAKGYSQYGFAFDARFSAYLADPATHAALYEYISENWGNEESTSQLAPGYDEYKAEVKQQFYNFMMGGGNTGWTQAANIQTLKREMDKKGWFDKPVIGDCLEIAEKLNEYSELFTRFAAYRAVMAMGKGEHEALKAAKNLSTNFNMKGYGNPFLNFFSSISMFCNAAIQGACSFYRSFDNANNAIRAIVSMVFLPALLGFLNTILCPDVYPDDKDKDKKTRHISDYYRENYVVIGNWKKPLPPELRPLWNIGVQAAMCMYGKRSVGETIYKILHSFTVNLLPIPPAVSDAIATAGDFLATGTGTPASIVANLFIPQYAESFIEVINDKDFMGNSLTRYDYGNIPQYKLGENEEQMYQDIAYGFYVMSGGNKVAPSKFKDGSLDKEISVNVNPRKVRAILSAFVSDGWLKTISSSYSLLKGLGEAFTNDSSDQKEITKYVKTEKLPLVSSFYKPERDGKVEQELYYRMNAMVHSFEAYVKDMIRIEKGKVILNDRYEHDEFANEVKNNVQKLIDRGVNPMVWKVLTEAYRKKNIQIIAKSVGLSEKELREKFPNQSQDEARQILYIIGYYMNEQLMMYDGIAKQIDSLQYKTK